MPAWSHELFGVEMPSSAKEMGNEEEKQSREKSTGGESQNVTQSQTDQHPLQSP